MASADGSLSLSLSLGTSNLAGAHMRTMVFFFTALFAVPVVQVAVGPHFERPVVVIDCSIETAVSQHLRARETGFPIAPRPERWPKAS